MSTPLSIQEIFNRPAGTAYDVTMTSQGTNGLVGYAVGSLVLKPPVTVGQVLRSATLTTGSGALLSSFSDRVRVIDTDPPGGLGVVPRQPFDDDQKDEIGLAVYQTFQRPFPPGNTTHAYGATLTFRSWGGGRMSIGLDPAGDFLFGVGPKVDGVQSAFLLSFRTIDRIG